jgi:hypothetical protein
MKSYAAFENLALPQTAGYYPAARKGAVVYGFIAVVRGTSPYLELRIFELRYWTEWDAEEKFVFGPRLDAFDGVPPQ